MLKTWSKISVVRGFSANSSSADSIRGTAAMNRSRLAIAIPGSAHFGKTMSSCTAIRANKFQTPWPGPPRQVRQVTNRTLGIAHAQPA